MRKAFLQKVSDIIRNESDTFFMTVDIGMWALKNELDHHSDRCMNIGIFEDGMMSFAAGLSRVGLVPTIFGIQPYLIERAFEQIKMDFAYQKLGVNIVGTGAACDYSKYGYSHYCPEDLMLIKCLPGCEFVAPGTPKQFIQLFNQSYRNGHPTFFRISDHPNLVHDVDVSFGKANVIQRGSLATVVVVSIMLDEVMKVCSNLDVTVLYYTTLEPFDANTLRENFSRNILIVEPEYEGSLLYDIYKAIGNKANISTLGFKREIFRNYGTYDDKMNYYGLNSSNILLKLDELIKTNKI